MKKFMNIFLQIVFGTFPIMFFWICGYIINDPYGDFMFTQIEDFISQIPWFVCFLIPICICILVIVFGVIGKKCNLNAMFWSALISTVLPIIGYGIMCVCSDDSSILSLFLMPLLLLLRPFGIMCMGTLDNITMSLYSNILTIFDESSWIVLMIASSVVAFLLYKILNKKHTVKNH